MWWGYVVMMLVMRLLMLYNILATINCIKISQSLSWSHVATESEGNNSVEGAVIIDEIQDSKWNNYLGLVNCYCVTYICYVENVAPKMKDINRYIATKYHYDWKNIGLELDLDYHQLDVIEINHKDNKAKFLDMIRFWIQRGGVATWKALEVALTNVKRQKLGLGPVDDVYGMITHLLHICIPHPPF